MNALGLMLWLSVRGEFDPCEGRLKILANVFTQKVSCNPPPPPTNQILKIMMKGEKDTTKVR